MMSGFGRWAVAVTVVLVLVAGLFYDRFRPLRCDELIARYGREDAAMMSGCLAK
jgi:hypothetical protein